MKFNRLLSAAAALAVILCIPLAYATGLWPGLPIMGGASYCTGVVTTAPGATTACTATAPAGPPAWTGNEVFPADTANGAGASSLPASTVLVTAPQLGQGLLTDNTVAAGTKTIPNLSPWFFLNAVQTTSIVVMPSAPLANQIQRVTCELALSTNLTVTANTGQSLNSSPNTSCTAGQTFSWVYNATNTTWYRF